MGGCPVGGAWAASGVPGSGQNYWLRAAGDRLFHFRWQSASAAAPSVGNTQVTVPVSRNCSRVFEKYQAIAARGSARSSAGVP